MLISVELLTALSLVLGNNFIALLLFLRYHGLTLAKAHGAPVVRGCIVDSWPKSYAQLAQVDSSSGT
jgi:hypothetical protein